MENYKSIIDLLASADIDLIEQDFNHSIEGIKFVYFIDPYDIMENYIPYTQSNVFDSKTEAYHSYLHLSYELFFNNYKESIIALPDTYKFELLAAKNYLLSCLKQTATVLQNIVELKSSLRDHFLFNTNLLTGKFDQLLTLLVLGENYESGIEKFFDFIRSHLDPPKIKFNSSETELNIIEYASQNANKEIEKEVFNRFIEQMKPRYLSLNQKDIAQHLENSFNDIKVINQVITANQFFNQNNLPYRAIYLSSAHKTKQITSIFENFKASKYPDSKEDWKVSRNIHMIFMLNLISDSKNDSDTHRTFSFLKYLTNYRPERSEPTENDSQKNTAPILNILDRITSELNTNISVIAFEKIYQKIHELRAIASQKDDVILEMLEKIRNENKKYHERLTNIMKYMNNIKLDQN